MAKVTAPSGLTVTRNVDNYTVTWKRGKSYSAQSMYYMIDDGTKTDVEIAKNTTSKVVAISKNTLYPKTDKKTSKIEFYIKGKYGRKWSAETKKEYAITVPPKPTLTATHSTSETEDSTTFSWSIDWGDSNKDEVKSIFTNYQWWTSLLPNSELDSDKITTWQENGTTTDNDDEDSKKIDETQAFTGDYSYTRYFKIVARGPAGDSKPAYEKHVYAFPNAPKNVKATATRMKNNSGYIVSAEWVADASKSRPIDSITLEYAIETPLSSYTDVNGVRKVTLSVPAISNWTTASTLAGSTDMTGKKDGDSFVVNGDIPSDKCIFVRVVAKHDNKTSPSETVFVSGGRGALSAPTTLSATFGTTSATVSVKNNSALTASFVGIYYRSDVKPNARLIGIYPAGATGSISVQLPSESANTVSLGAKAILADYSPITAQISGVTNYSLSNILMDSGDMVWDNRPVPKPPSKIGLSSPRSGVVRVTWDWTWTDANSVELSWADHDDAWESTSGPSTHLLENTDASAWNVAGLEVGTWYFRIRLIKMDTDATTYGTYSDIYSIKLASSPATPVLTLSPSILPPDGKVTCYWAFTATDGDEQTQADICEATVADNGAVTYGQILAKASSEQYKTLDVKELGWTAGSKHFLAVRIITASGEESDNWSVPKPVQILNPILSVIYSTSLETITIVDDPEQSISHQQLSLTHMPLNITAGGAGESGTMTYILERASDYHLDRPDENDYTGFQGETIAIVTKSASGSPVSYASSITNDDLIGTLDDGASYNLIAIATDSYGQTAENSLTFEVHWAHKAVMPSAGIIVDNEDLVTYITPTLPTSGYVAGDTCDIYRLSIDKPELIISGAEFGTTYVDPYPALGSMGGHRIVYKTANGDYITSSNEFAWTDYNDILNKFATIIDYGDDQVILPYDISLSNSWKKDFTQTKYLGGSVEGDWNPAVERSGSVKTRVSVEDDPELLEAMRRLATYAGICHVRTPDGSSYAANVDVTEDREERKINMLATFSLDVTRIDSAGFDGMTYEEWLGEDE